MGCKTLPNFRGTKKLLEKGIKKEKITIEWKEDFPPFYDGMFFINNDKGQFTESIIWEELSKKGYTPTRLSNKRMFVGKDPEMGMFGMDEDEDEGYQYVPSIKQTVEDGKVLLDVEIQGRIITILVEKGDKDEQ